MIDYSKWNKYEIGKIPWVNSRKDHLSKHKYVEYILNQNIDNILEVGGGEVLEAQEIRKIKPDINYTILDVSDTFLKNAKEKGFNVIKGEMNKTNFENNKFELVYFCSVLEHSPDLESTFKELKRISKFFYFTMFKWKFKSGGLKSHFHKKRKFFTTEFNINKLIKLIENYGDIRQLFICTLDNKVIDYYQYIKKYKKLDVHRNGNFLSIIGKFRKD